MPDRIGRCPTCGKATGYLMESHPDAPGLLERLRGANGQADRWLMAFAVLVLAALALTATRAIFHVF